MTVDAATQSESPAARILRHWLVRLLILFVAMLALDFAVQFAAVLPILFLPSLPRAWVALAIFGGATPLLILAYRRMVRWLERRRTSELESYDMGPGLLTGILVGFVLFTAVMALLVASGHGAVALPAVLAFPTLALAVSLLSGVAEELAFRGALFRIVEERFGTLVGLLVSAAFFGLIHIGNPGATIMSSIAIALEAGLLLALAYTATRSLWLPIGLHFAWNFTEGGIFGSEVSGGKVPGILTTTLNGPEIVTGGPFGPEASVVATAVCLVAAASFLAITIQRGQWRPFTTPSPP